jgi:hypothetical protein
MSSMFTKSEPVQFVFVVYVMVKLYTNNSHTEGSLKKIII